MNTKVASGVLVLVVLVGALLYAFSGSKYGEIGPRGYEYATALYSCCNRRDKDQLQTIKQMIQEDQSTQAISQQETTWLGEIVQSAESGKWTEASESVRQLMEDQVQQK